MPFLSVRGSPLPQKTPDFCWLRLQQENNGQTTGWRWTQPAQSSLLPSFSMHVCLSYCQTDSPLSAVAFSPLPLTTESWLSSNVKRMRLVLSSYLKQHSWTSTKMIRRMAFTVLLAAKWQEQILLPLCLRKGKAQKGGDANKENKSTSERIKMREIGFYWQLPSPSRSSKQLCRPVVS